MNNKIKDGSRVFHKAETNDTTSKPGVVESTDGRMARVAWESGEVTTEPIEFLELALS